MPMQHEKFAQNRQTEERELMIFFLLILKSRNEDRMKLWAKNFRCHCCRLFKYYNNKFAFMPSQKWNLTKVVIKLFISDLQRLNANIEL